MPKILIVEDEAPLADTIAYNLREEGYKVVIAKDGMTALELLKQEAPDLVLLDLMIPKIDGLEVCRNIRRNSTIPVIILTAKSREVDKVVGLEVGADDYITKPFGMLELIARIRAALRRSKGISTQSEILSAHDIEIDSAKHTVLFHGNEIVLRPKEFDLLHLLMSNRGRVIERSSLLDNIWGEDEYIDAGTVDVHIRRLREKVEENPSKPVRVLTVRGIGYKFAE